MAEPKEGYNSGITRTVSSGSLDSNGDYVAGGAALVRDIFSVPATRERWFIVPKARTGANSIIANAATPTPATGANLVTRSPSNAPTWMQFNITIPDGLADAAGGAETSSGSFVLAINTGSAAAAAAAINAAFDSNGAGMAAPAVQNDTNHSSVLMVPAGVAGYLYDHGSEITDVYGGQMVNAGGGTNGGITAQIDFL